MWPQRTLRESLSCCSDSSGSRVPCCRTISRASPKGEIRAPFSPAYYGLRKGLVGARTLNRCGHVLTHLLRGYGMQENVTQRRINEIHMKRNSQNFPYVHCHVNSGFRNGDLVAFTVPISSSRIRRRLSAKLFLRSFWRRVGGARRSG